MNVRVTLLIYLCICLQSLSFSQSKKISITWPSVSKAYITIANTKYPAFDSKMVKFDAQKGFIIFKEWQVSQPVSEVNYTISNIQFDVISKPELFGLKDHQIPNTIRHQLKNTNARGLQNAYLEISAIINDNGTYKKVKSFTVSYSSESNQTINSNRNPPTNSVLANGTWYRFYVEKTGMHVINKQFLNSIGFNTNGIDPRTIKILGNGGRMLPYLNTPDYQTETPENAIKIVGEQDGVFNDNDFILFYGEGPDRYDQESDTYRNLYTDRIYYYIGVSSGLGKRVNSINEPAGVPNLFINTFDDEQFYEVEEFNLAKIGRRWYGDDFDVENTREYPFNFPNLVSTEPVNVRVKVGVVSSDPSSMDIVVNGEVGSLNLAGVNLENVLASASTFNNSYNINTDDILLQLQYNNNGNPSANAFLDYITIAATRNLVYTNSQMYFKNNSVATNSGIAEYSITNANNIYGVWDVTDRFNAAEKLNNNSSSTFSFKATAGEARQYIVFSGSDLLEPKTNGNAVVGNFNLKGTIFNNQLGQFQDIDYLILTPQAFSSQAERLAQINRNQYNLNVKVVTLESIYNEFSTSNPDLAALRNFVRYVYENASTPNNALKYVCLFGDGSYDYRNRIPNNTNFVPSWYSKNSSSLSSSYVSDDFYAMMDNGEGLMLPSDRMDLAVGRILANDLNQAKVLVDKIETYYRADAYGDWRNRILLISDDVDLNWEGSLQQNIDNIATTLETERPFFNSVKVLADSYQQETTSGGERYPDANAAIRDVIDLGALVVNYYGHGGEDGLTAERIFDRNDAQNVNNLCKYNCFITVTCEFTKFDDPQRQTAGEFTYWNKNGGSIAMFTTTRQIFANIASNFNITLNKYLYAFNQNEYPTIGEALRLTKNDPAVAGSNQKLIVFLIGDPAMKLAIPKPQIVLTHINDTPITGTTDVLQSLSLAKLSGEVQSVNGTLLSNYNGEVTVTVYDKEIDRQTLANDNTLDTFGNIIQLDFKTLGEVLFKGKATVSGGKFSVEFIVPRDIGVPVGNGRVSFYSKESNLFNDQTGYNTQIQIGGVNPNAIEDNLGPIINLFMNDENFVSGGITNESPTLIAKLYDDNGINTASGIGHDITAVLDGDTVNPFILNSYYVADADTYQSGVVTFPFRDLEPGLHTITFKAWDVYNNSSTAEIQFIVFDQDEELVINNVLNYPNPFVSYTEFWFNHNSSDILDISVQIFTISGKLVKTINGQTNSGNKGSSSLSRDIVWDGRDDFGDKIGKGVYIYKLKVRSDRLNKTAEKTQKLVIL